MAVDAEPTILDMLGTGSKAVRGEGDKTADFIRGSDYEALIGPPSVIWARQARRDTDLFNAAKFHTSRGPELTERVKKQFGIDRFMSTRGVGTTVFTRPTTAGNGGTIWQGTRIALLGGGQARQYRVTASTEVQPEELSVTVPIEAFDFGPGSAITTTGGLRLDDALWDATLRPTFLTCANGDSYELDAELIARALATRTAARVGQTTAINAACLAAGASKVLILRSDFGGPGLDHGLNVVYVGDSGYSGTAGLVRACRIALRNVRVLGDNLQVLPMARVEIPISVDIFLNAPPATFDLARLEVTNANAIRQYLGGPSGGFVFSIIGMSSAIARTAPDTQRVSVVLPASDANILTAGNFPPVLNRYVVSTIALRYHGP